MSDFVFITIIMAIVSAVITVLSFAVKHVLCFTVLKLKVAKQKIMNHILDHNKK